MGQPRLIGACVLVAALLLALAADFPRKIAERGAPGDGQGADYVLDEATADADHVPLLDGDIRAATFTFAPGTAPGAERAFSDAIARSRPEAQRLVALVDGLTTVQFGAAAGGAAGTTQANGDGHYDLVIDLDGVMARHGLRGVSRVVMHELGHVVDFALLRDSLVKQLDAGIPPGYPCDEGASECHAVEERFAESFAKWATGDIGVDVYLGYKVPPPLPLEQWGAPLAALVS